MIFSCFSQPNSICFLINFILNCLLKQTATIEIEDPSPAGTF